MSAKPNRPEGLTGAADVAAGSALPAASDDAADLPVQPPAAVADVADPLEGVRFSGCGAACDCCWWIRVGCAMGTHVEKLGGRYLVCRGDEVISAAEPGFEPLVEEVDEGLEWAAKAEFARDHDLPQPGDWPKEWHRFYEADGGLELLAIANSREVGIVRRAIERQRHFDAYVRWADRPKLDYCQPSPAEIEARQRFLSKFIGEVGD